MALKCVLCKKPAEATINGECVACFRKNGKNKVIQSINSHFTSMAKIVNRKSQRGD